jgi:GTP-binding protein
MHFIDEVTIHVKAGNGGNGIITFRHEKFRPKGGPDGGNGGRGGSVILRADHHLNTLLDFKYRRHVLAERGENGRSKDQAGKSGADTVLKVPCGTVVREVGNKKIVADLVKDGDEIVIAQAGRGGRGNSEFATPTDQAPRRAENGTLGEEKEIVLELKLLADVALVGFPNAGKSTLISVISAARPKIADYPFTTLTPNLGIVRYAEGKSFVVADIPGLLEGAHEGKGLGIQFLRHIERTRVLVFLIEATSKDPKQDYKILRNELKSYSSKMMKKPKLIAITKMDLLDEEARKPLKKLSIARGIKIVKISAATNENIDDLKDVVWKLLQSVH